MTSPSTSSCDTGDVPAAKAAARVSPGLSRAEVEAGEVEEVEPFGEGDGPMEPVASHSPRPSALGPRPSEPLRIAAMNRIKARAEMVKRENDGILRDIDALLGVEAGAEGKADAERVAVRRIETHPQGFGGFLLRLRAARGLTTSELWDRACRFAMSGRETRDLVPSPKVIEAQERAAACVWEKSSWLPVLKALGNAMPLTADEAQAWALFVNGEAGECCVWGRVGAAVVG